MATLVKLYEENPNPKQIAEVVKVLKSGGLVIYPTDTIYGLGCDITNNKALGKIAKIKGDFVWHSHENEDELFWVLKGKLFMEFRDGTKEINEGEMLIVPRGVEHRPVAPEEVHIVLFEPAGTLNTGNAVESELTRNELKEI